MSGPCSVCGATNYSPSYGGPSICPECDCGIPPEATKLRRELSAAQDEIVRLRAAGRASAPEPSALPQGWPAGLLERVKAAEQRVQDNRAPRSIPADPHSDVDLVLAEVRYLIEGRSPPFWIAPPLPAQQEKPE